MSQRFHPFHAPPQNAPQTPKRASLPLPTITSRKAATRLFRDVRFGIRSLSKPQQAVSAAILAVVVLICLRSALSNQRTLNFSVASLRPTECACPVPKTPLVFAEQILNPAGFVAKVRIASSSPEFLILQVLELYRGNVRSVQWPLVVRTSVTALCRDSGIPSDSNSAASPSSEWLVSGGGIKLAPAELTTTLPVSAKHNNFSILLPGEVKGPRCQPRHLNADENSEETNRLVWMTPWRILSRAVAESIERDPGNEPLWWRTNDASIEFKDAVRRTVLTSHAEKPASESSVATDSGSERREFWLRPGTSVIAACKDRTETLQQAILTWQAAHGVDEIVLVDWSSDPPIQTSLSDDVAGDPRLVLVRVHGQSQWILSRAYNLAARSASFSKVLKVDCDSVITPDFLETHVLETGSFFAGDWRQLKTGSSNALHTNGLLYVNRDDFLTVGGFDERITTYGWDDSDVAERLAKVRDARFISHDKVSHIYHSASLRVANQPKNSLLPPSNPHAAAVEIQRNRLLLTKHNLPAWRASSFHTVWNAHLDNQLFREQHEKKRDIRASPILISARAANEVTEASALVSDADAENVSKRSIRLILRRLGLPLLPKTLSLDFYKALITKIASPDKYAEVVVSLQGGCVSKLLGHVFSKEATRPGSLTPSHSTPNDLFIPPPYPYIGWRPQELWLSSDGACSCNFSSIFEATDEEILSEWVDTANQVERILGRPAGDDYPGFPSVLRSFSSASTVKNMSAELARWYPNRAPSRMLITEAVCPADPKGLSSTEQMSIRRGLATLVPSRVIVEGIHNALATQPTTILDSDIFNVGNRSSILSGRHADKIRESLTSTESIQMLSKWTTNPFRSDNPLVNGLDKRARSVMVLTHLIERGWDTTQVPKAVSTDLKGVLSNFSHHLTRLFQGCEPPSSDYLEAYPELAVVIAGFLSAHLCV